MRYVSPHPWGSLRAEANRRGSSIEQIVEKVWNPDPWAANAKPFHAGGGVLWSPVVVSRTGRIRTLDQIQTKQWLQQIGWLASRQQPVNELKTGTPNPLYLELTSKLAETIHASRERGTIAGEMLALYDCRFLLRFSIPMMPQNLVDSITGPGQTGRIAVQPHTKWHLPKIVWQREGVPDEVFISDVKQESGYDIINHLQEMLHGPHPNALSGDDSSAQRWIKIESVRSLKAI
jgi:tRNA(Ile)-lysidine synthase